MTACNVLAAPDAAYLLTDTAILDPRGRVWHLHPKVVHCERLRIAAAITGDVNTFENDDGQLASPLGAVEGVFADAETQRDALAALPAALEDAYAAVAEASGGTGNFLIMVALWDLVGDEAQAYIVVSPGVTQMPGAAPFQLLRFMEFLSPGAPGGFADPLALIEAQRRKKAETGSVAGFHTIGGEGRLMRIDGNGITIETIVRWPDRIGRAIYPDRRRWLDRFRR